MKKTIFSLFVLFVMLLSSCKKEVGINESATIAEDATVSTTSLVTGNAEKDARKLKVAKALAKALTKLETRQMIKDEALKKFDGDYDILYANAKTKKLPNGKSLEEDLFGTAQDISTVDPTLNIYVTELVGQNAATWNVNTHTPKVVYVPSDYDDMKTPTVTAYDAQGHTYVFDNFKEPTEILVVISDNERVDDKGKLIVGFRPTDGKPVLQTRANYRTDGQPEGVWQVNVPFLKDIESWTNGGPEIECFAVSPIQGPLNIPWDITGSRSQFCNTCWQVVDKPVLSQWNWATFGNYIRYHWFEDDINSNNATSLNFTIGTSNMQYVINRSTNDENMGFSQVSKDDVVWQNYLSTGPLSKQFRWYMKQ